MTITSILVFSSGQSFATDRPCANCQKSAFNGVRELALESSPICFEQSLKMEKSKNPEADLRELLKDLSNSELLARLTYSEALASQCPSDAVFRGIAWTIMNRTRDGRYGREIQDVVFAEKQFRSSLGGYESAKRRDFICPDSKSPHWKSAVKFAAEALAGESNPLPRVRHYYLFKHFNGSRLEKKIRPPSWVNSGKTIALENADVNCIRFFDLQK